MAVSDRHRRQSAGRAGRRVLTGVLAGTAWLSLAAGCAHTPPPAEPEDPSAFPVPPTVTAPPPPPPPREAPRPVTPRVVQISPTAEESEGNGSLVEAAKAERERRLRSGEPLAVITDKNLAQYAEGGKLTYVEETAGTSAAGSAPAAGVLDQEEYWRNRALDIRLQWRRAVEDIEQLKLRAAELRQRFYAEDDPFIRDGQIKPDWDHTLEQLNQARDDARRYQAELDRLYEEARQADVEPAWLQEGADIEPEPQPAESEPGQLPEHQVVEPPEAPGGGPR